jgi:hypothetical protein
MITDCKKGEIWRVGYARSSKNGSKKINIKGNCIKATSQTGKKTTKENKKYLSKRKEMHKLARSKFGVPDCNKGEIIREGFERNTVNGKKIWIQPICVKATGEGKKKDQLFRLEPKRLSKYGYDKVVTKTDLSRHKILKNAMHSGEKPLSLSRRLNALATLTKNTNPTTSKIFKNDYEWVKTTKEYKNR